ncbi:kinase-like protein [Aspergillus carlsbadensis]|nr:kinase-like protein [Aspergillus carlsbadensis]
MFSLLRRLVPPVGWRWNPLDFTNPSFVCIPEYHKIEEETLPEYVASAYYSTRIGEVIRERYQVVGKLGFGSTSTVWLARDLSARRHVMLKIFARTSFFGQRVDHELEMYRRIERSPKGHPGRDAIRTLIDTFDIDGPGDRHRCLVHPPLWESTLTFLRRNPVERLPSAVLAMVLWRLFLALDYLHTECEIVHTDVKADNIMLGINDDSVFSDFEEKELERPVPRKEVSPDGRLIYMSRDLRVPKNPNIYRTPEVIIRAPWTYSVDIWNVGCMIWDIYEGGSLFTGQDSEFQRYRSHAHLAEIINLLGPPPSTLLAKRKMRGKFFTDKEEFRASHLLTDLVPLEERENTLEGEKERAAFLRLMRKMLQWEPSKRSSARELAEDEWIQSHV